jgi:TolA-binding protein
MKEPKRLLSHGATDFERQLLRAVVNERPSALLRSRMQRGLGLVGPLAWASTVKAMLGSAAGKVTALVTGGVLVAAGVTALNLVPDRNVEVLATPAAATAAAPASADVSPGVASPAALPGGPAAARVSQPSLAADANGAAAAAAPEPTPNVGSPALAEPSAESATAAPAAEPAADEDDRRLREEIALLDAARSALERGDREAARSSLRSYRERFPSGVLAREANVLRRRAEPARAKPRAGR